MSTINDMYAREEQHHHSKRRAWLMARLSGLAVLAAATFTVVYLALARQF
jgi:succinate dehydrogenase hydrophobic anchor subunit